MKKDTLEDQVEWLEGQIELIKLRYNNLQDRIIDLEDEVILEYSDIDQDFIRRFTEALKVLCRFNAKKISGKKAIFEIMDILDPEYSVVWNSKAWGLEPDSLAQEIRDKLVVKKEDQED